MIKQYSMGKISRVVCALFAATVMFVANPFQANAESKGTITVDSAKVRADASTSADTVGTAGSGTTVTISEEKTDSSGNVWYHVTCSDGTTGYVRSDLLKVDETTAAADTSDTSAEASTDPAGEPVAISTGDANIVNGIDVSIITIPDGVSAQDLQKATVNVAIGKIRSDASTNDSIVAQLAQGTDLVISGSKMGSDSKTWYYATFMDGGSVQNGYIRSDLVSMGDVIILNAPEQEPVATEESEPAEEETEVNNDYELVYTDDGTGTNVWYLYNHIDNTREKLQELLDYADAQESKQAANENTIKTMKLILIILGAALLIALVVIIILAVRLRGYDYDYDDDDDDEEDEDDVEEDEVEEDDEEEEAAYVRSRRNSKNRRSNRRRYEDDEEEEEEVEVRTTRDSRDTRPTPSEKKKTKNFMLDDDDFEFEFLNMDDK